MVPLGLTSRSAKPSAPSMGAPWMQNHFLSVSGGSSPGGVQKPFWQVPSEQAVPSGVGAAQAGSVLVTLGKTLWVLKQRNWMSASCGLTAPAGIWLPNQLFVLTL